MSRGRLRFTGTATDSAADEYVTKWFGRSCHGHAAESLGRSKSSSWAVKWGKCDPHFMKDVAGGAVRARFDGEGNRVGNKGARFGLSERCWDLRGWHTFRVEFR